MLPPLRLCSSYGTRLGDIFRPADARRMRTPTCHKSTRRGALGQSQVMIARYYRMICSTILYTTNERCKRCSTCSSSTPLLGLTHGHQASEEEKQADGAGHQPRGWHQRLLGESSHAQACATRQNSIARAPPPPHRHHQQQHDHRHISTKSPVAAPPPQVLSEEAAAATIAKFFKGWQTAHPAAARDGTTSGLS